MIPVEKYHGTGNDFVVVGPDQSVPDRRAFARRYCDRANGIEPPPETTARRGADGVLFLAIEAEYTPPRVIMTLVQPDGSVAPMCGNGVRCAAHWAAQRTNSTELMVDTLAGTRHVTITDGQVCVEMGQPTFAPAEVPLDRETPLIDTEIEGLSVTAVNTGVPHAVALVDDVQSVDLATIGPRIRNASVFPEGANLTIGTLQDTAPTTIEQRTFERGVEDETASCGTGAVAVVAAANTLGLIDGDEPVAVELAGGTLSIDLRDPVPTMTGPVEHTYSTELSTETPELVGR